MKRRLAGTLLCLSLAAPAAKAATDNACWNRDLERMDYYTNPPEGGDNNFFTTVVAQTGNVTLIYPDTYSLRGFVVGNYEMRAVRGGATPTGCTNAYLNGLTYFMPTTVAPPAGASTLQGLYKPATTYPDPLATYTSSGGTTGFSGTSAYRYLNWPANDAGTAETVSTACLNAAGATNQAACVACVNSNGYWINPAVTDIDTTASAGVYSGNFLNFYPPKWVMLKLAYKRLVNGPLLSSLREAVVAENGKVGGQTVQKMLPQSCQGAGRPLNQKLAAIDSVTYTSTANPLAETLWNTAWYMGGQQNPWSYFSNSSAYYNLAMVNGKSGPCSGCNSDFIVLFSDGRGDTANPTCTVGANGKLPPGCTAAAACSTLGMGAEDDGNDFLDPSMVGGTGSAITGVGVRQTALNTCDMDFADDVATWIHKNNSDPNTPNSTISVFVVGIGSEFNNAHAILQAIAANGNPGAKSPYLNATDFATLESNIQQVLYNIIQRSTSFSVAAITTVQTRGSTYAFIPRFKPLQGPNWNGALYRFKLFNEFAAGCSSGDYGIKDYANPNGNNSCNDIYLRDANNNFIGEDSNGNFVLLDTSQPYGANGWPIKTTPNPDGGAALTTPAVPVWEAAQVLSDRIYTLNGGTPASGPSDGGVRQMYTVLPQAGGTGAWTPTLVSFDTTNLANLTPALQLGGVNGVFCFELAAVTRHTYATESDCAADLINFVRGQDVLLQNPLNRPQALADGGIAPPPSILYARPNVLGDIFHSSPILVTPPAPQFICDLGVATQCLFSLYSSTLTKGGPTAYPTYQTNKQYRDEILVVGANDGMVHAFNAGVDTFGVNPDAPPGATGSAHYFNYGSGQEVWGFIPPDLLPKLQRIVFNNRHDLLVDGTPMVRDIWVDGSGAAAAKDGIKQADEFHTVMIIGEREGGRHYTALDITNTSGPPTFLWSWPYPGSAEDIAMGETWNDSAPLPPPIGPVAVQTTLTPPPLGIVHGAPAEERYVVAVGGGYDPNGVRGRSIFVLDAWTGKTLLRFAHADNTGPADPRSYLFPVAATPSMLDTDNDGLFDKLVVGDVSGQMWTIDMTAPGLDTDGDGTFDNWFGGRGFIQFSGQALYHRSPFFAMAAAAIIPSGDIRVYLGSGDRDQIKDTNGGTCAVNNLRACIRKDCGVTVNVTEQRIGPPPAGGLGGNFLNGSWSYASGGTGLATNSFNSNIPPEAQSAACTDVDDVQISYNITCGTTANTFTNNIYCDWGTTTPNVECPSGLGRPLGAKVPYTSAVVQENARFYSYKLFDSGVRAPFSTAMGAQTYDTNALTEAGLVNADVTPAASNGNGYWIQYPKLDEKTSSGALLLAGCVLWNTLLPTTATLTCQGTLPPDTANTYQADAVTGAIQCGTAGSATAVATTRYVSTSSIVPRPTFNPVVSVNSKGQVSYGGVSITPGSPPLQISVGANDVLGTIHYLEVPRLTHNCRHTAVGCQ